MSNSLSQAHRRYIARETAIGAVVNSMISVAFASLALGGRSSIPLWGLGGAAVDFVPQTFFMFLVSTAAVTLITRQRLRGGAVIPLDASDGGALLKGPHSAWLRGLTVACAATVILSPICIALLVLFGADEMSGMTFLFVKVAYAALASVVSGPFIVRAALARTTV